MSETLMTLGDPGAPVAPSIEVLAGSPYGVHVTNTLVLGPVLRYVDATSATIWVEVAEAGTVTVLGTTASTFCIEDHHFALVMLERLQPGTTVEYDVKLDGAIVWPDPDSALPASVIRVPDVADEVSILVGSCRAAAPHEPPYTLELAFDSDGRGVDTLWAHARRMASQDPKDWPTMLLLVGDQIYADDSSPRAKERIESRRPSECDLPVEVVADFEEYCWLYREAWSLPWERWFLSVVPSAMIFDDHDMIDDWNISESWVADVRQEPWWETHAVGGVMSYWVYQHLGNLSPVQIREEGLLERLLGVDDGGPILTEWAKRSEEFTPMPGGYRFSFARQVGDVTVVVIDSRNGRVLTEGSRLMVDDDEWDWVRTQALDAPGHLILATSLPVFIPDGLHDLQVWNERVCDGAWGRRAARVGERIRQRIDLEDWPAFAASYGRFVDLLDELRESDEPPTSILVASGDIHFSYAARVQLSGDAGPTVWQVVSSPIRNALIPTERGVVRMTMTRAGSAIGAVLRRLSKAADSRPRIDMAVGPFFANNMCELFYRGDSVELVVEHSTPSDDDEPELTEIARMSLQ